MTKKGVLLCSVVMLSAFLLTSQTVSDILPREDIVAFRLAGVTQGVVVQGEDKQALPDDILAADKSGAKSASDAPAKDKSITAPAATNKTSRSRVIADRSSATRNRQPVSTPKPPAPPQPKQEEQPAGNTLTSETYIVKQGDTLWTISQAVGIPMPELLKANNLTEQSTLYSGMTLSILKRQVAQKPTAGPQYGELLDWWTEAQYVWPIGKNAQIVDLRTGKSFMVRRSYGAFHADVEPLTAQDTAIMKEIWGGWSWATRPVIVEVDGRRLAASANGMPHSIQSITDNNFDGHFCIHFLNSTRHKDNLVQADHQQNVRTAAGQ